MSHKELELINLIRSTPDPSKTLQEVIELLAYFIKINAFKEVSK